MQDLEKALIVGVSLKRNYVDAELVETGEAVRCYLNCMASVVVNDGYRGLTFKKPWIRTEVPSGGIIMVRIARKDDCSGNTQLKCMAWVSERKWSGVRGNLDKRRLYRLVVDGETRWKGYDIAEVVFQKHLGQILPGESESLEHRHNGIWKSSGPLKTQICCLKPWFFEQFAPPGMVQPACTHD